MTKQHLTHKFKFEIARVKSAEINFKKDGVNRDSGKVTDPNELKLETVKDYNPCNKPIAETDGNGNTTRYFYDKAGNKRFKVDAEGGVCEWIYDKANRIKLQRNYLNPIDTSKLNNDTTLEKIIELSKKSQYDKLHYQYYDDIGRIRFLANSQGAIAEKIYDKVNREVAQKAYATAVDPTKLPDVTTDELAELIKTDIKDRNTYCTLDAEGQERFSFDAESYVTEQRFDNMGRVITKIEYAKAVANPESIYDLSPNEVSEEISKRKIKNPVNDRATYYVFDHQGNPQFLVNPEGVVTKYYHDANGNKIKTSEFATTITVPDSYDDLVKYLNTLKEDSSKDRITQIEYDKANREQIITDALQNQDQYQYNNALNKKNKHIDRAGESWNAGFDTAARLDTETTPPFAVTATIFDEKTKKLELGKVTTTPAVKKIEYDKANNQTQITMGFGTADARPVKFGYDKCNRHTTTSCENVAIDDPTKNADFNHRPEKSVIVTKTTVYNARGKEIVKQNERGYGHFYVYDSEDNLLYEVNALGGVIKYERNTFGETETKIKI